jgi:hypothetical protein
MSEYLSTEHGARAKELINLIDGSLKSLAAEMRANAGRIRVDAIWEIPLRDAALVDKNKPIVPIEHKGIDAANLAIECLTNIWLRAGQNMRETMRAPGIVGMPAELIAQVRKSNELRLKLYNLMKPLNQKERSVIWRAHSNISALQTQRLTHVFNEPKAVRFYWDVAYSMRRVAAHDLAAEYSAALKETHGYDPEQEGLPEDSADRKFARARDKLLALGAREPVAIYRPGQPHVRARIHYGGNKPIITPTSVPFVYDIDQVEAPKIVALRSYEPPVDKTGGARSRAKLEPYPMESIETLHIHQYLPEHRQPMPDAKDGEQTPHTRHQRNKPESK